MTRVVCVLSGGSVKGGAHVGAVGVLMEQGLAPSHFIGTSIGSVVGASFAAGVPYDRIVEMVTTLTRRDVAALSPAILRGPFAEHLFQGKAWRRTIERLVPARRFQDLEIPLTVTAVDADTGELVLFGADGEDAPLVDALYASCALPVYYPPARIGGRTLVDGGVRSVFPLDAAARFEPELTVGVYVGPLLTTAPPPGDRPSPGFLGVHRRAMRIAMAAQAADVIERHREREDLLLVEPRITGRASFAVERLTEYIARGRRATLDALSARRGSPSPTPRGA